MPVALIAQVEGGTPPAAGRQGEPIPFYLTPQFLLVMFGLFFLVVWWPAQRRQKKEQAAMMAALKIGTKVVTTAGIVGTIAKIKDGEDEITLRSEDTKIRVLRSTVARVLGSEEVKA